VTSPELSVRELLEFYAVLGRDVAAQESSIGALEAITNVAVQAIVGAHFASITRGQGESYSTVAPTDNAAFTADSAQYRLRSGPCLDALDRDTLIVTGNVAIDARWPQWGPEVSERPGVMSVVAVRLVVEEEEMVAALNIYSRDQDAFSDDAVTMAHLLATHGALAVSRVIAREKATNLARAVTTNREIGMAMGVLMMAYKVTEDEAFDLLRIASQGSHRKINGIARDVIDTGVLDLPDAPGRRPPGRNSKR
jgi:GAF domain-containing protein